MRDLSKEEIGNVYGAGGHGRSGSCYDPCKGSRSRGSRSKGSHSRGSKSHGSRGKGSRSKGRCY